MKLTGSTLFSGGEGVGIGMCNAGITHLQGIEYDDRIADVARQNGFNTKTGDVRAEDYSKWKRPMILHASPVCKNASNAKADGTEDQIDIETADATCRAITALKPRVFTLENVWGYRHFQAFKNILKALRECGYTTEYWHLNSADFGVPQTRKRLILVAALDFTPRAPTPTHGKEVFGLFDPRKPWIGWYEAIEDLIPTLPESKFAKWQLARLPKEFHGSTLFGNNASDDKKGGTYGVPARNDFEPSLTVMAQTMFPMKAFITDTRNQRSLNDGKMTILDGGEPMFTTVASNNPNRYRAFLMQVQELGGDGVRGSDEPSQTLMTGHSAGKYRAFLVNESSTMEVRSASAPAPTQLANGRNGGQGQRAWLESGRVVKMTPRALARFQSFPDSYELPENTRLACTVIGNAVPPLLYQAVIRAQRELFT